MAAPQVHSGLNDVHFTADLESNTIFTLESDTKRVQENIDSIVKLFGLQSNPHIHPLPKHEWDVILRYKARQLESLQKETSAARSAGIASPSPAHQQPAVQQRSAEELRDHRRRYIVEGAKETFDGIIKASPTAEYCEQRIKASKERYIKNFNGDQKAVAYINKCLSFFIREFKKAFPADAHKENQVELACCYTLNTMLKNKSVLLRQPEDFWI